jgi:excisionase family DNA binding protein
MEVLRLGRRSVYQLIEDGTLAARKMAGKYRIPKRNLVEIISAISPEMCYNRKREISDALQQ